MPLNSELRQDMVTGDWYIMAPGRANRPMEFFMNKSSRIPSPVDKCPFEEPQKSGNEEPKLLYADEAGNWRVQIIPNRYPALRESTAAPLHNVHGPYSILEGLGAHEIIIGRDHDKNFPAMDAEQSRLIFRAFQERYRALMDGYNLNYVLIFQNWGPGAGASVYHPHCQLIGLPVVPPDIARSLHGSERYYEHHNTCVHCAMLEFEKKEVGRIIYETDKAIAFTPYVSHNPFEIRVFPKAHFAHFEDAKDEDRDAVVDVLCRALGSLRDNLGDPDYNFFIHTAPIAGKGRHDHYHWHIEIYPKITTEGGFELGTGLLINVIDPDEAGKFLRGGIKS